MKNGLNAKSNDAVNLLWPILIFLILGFPRILQIPKMALCLLIVLSSVGANNQFRVYPSLYKFICPWMVYVAITVFTGVIYGNSDAGIIAFVKVNVLNVLLYSLLLLTINSVNTLTRIFQGMVVATLYISLYNLLLAICAFLHVDISSIAMLDATSGVGIHSGYTHLVTTNSSMLIMLFPLLLLMKDHPFVKNAINNKIYMVAIGGGAVTMALSGRRVLWISLAVSLIFFAFGRTPDVMKLVKRFVAFIVIFALCFYVVDKMELLSINGSIDRFLFAFADFDEYGQANVRNAQSGYLLKGFCDKIVFGNGAGATISGFQRSLESPWMFELSYHVCLFQSGVVGGILYFASLLVIALNAVHAKKKDDCFGHAILVTYSIILFANATNPYFSSSFDFLIFLFMPLLLVESVVAGNVSLKNVNEFNGMFFSKK
jgi:hypothetical protein